MFEIIYKTMTSDEKTQHYSSCHTAINNMAIAEQL